MDKIKLLRHLGILMDRYMCTEYCGEIIDKNKEEEKILNTLCFIINDLDFSAISQNLLYYYNTYNYLILYTVNLKKGIIHVEVSHTINVHTITYFDKIMCTNDTFYNKMAYAIFNDALIYRGLDE